MCFLLMISLFRKAHKHHAEVLASVPENKIALTCLIEIIYLLDKCCLGMNHRAVCHEFNINELTVILN